VNLALTTADFTVCSCTHLTDFATKLSKRLGSKNAKNGGLAALFDPSVLARNIAVVATVLGVYIFLLISCWKGHKKDQLELLKSEMEAEVIEADRVMRLPESTQEHESRLTARIQELKEKLSDDIFTSLEEKIDYQKTKANEVPRHYQGVQSVRSRWMQVVREKHKYFNVIFLTNGECA
jgi:hypothetical protein